MTKRWCYNSEEINNFFSAIKKDPPGIKIATAPIQFNAFSTVFDESIPSQLFLVW